MLTQRIANIAFAALMLIACLYFINAAFDFDDLSLPGSTQLSSRFFPITVLLFIAVCMGVVLFQYVTRRGVGLFPDETVYGSRLQAIRGLLTFTAVVGCFIIWKNFGFVPAALVMGPAAAAAMGVRNPFIYGLLLVISYVIYFAFTRLLGVQL